jgi:hypothetical protein
MPDLDLVRLLRVSHVLAGFIGLALFWIPIVTPKGGRLHVFWGRLFTYFAYYAGGTGFLFSVWALVHPRSFFRDAGALTERELALAIEGARFLYSITGFLALTVLAGTYFGVRVVQAKGDHAQLRKPVLLTVLGLFGLWSVALGIFGVASLIACRAGGHVVPAADSGRYWVSVVLGAIGAYGALGDFRYVLRPPVTPMSWWYQHMECMLGAGIGFHSAAFFFVSKELLHLPLQGTWQLAPLLLPLAIGVPIMWVWIARYERAFEGSASEATR